MIRQCIKRVLLALILIALPITTAPVVLAAQDPILDLADAVAFWQEQALQAAHERDKLRAELEQTKAEQDRLLQDREDLEIIVRRLQSERNDALENAKAEAILRVQAERDLDIALATIESLQTALQRLAGPRFGLLIGGTYDPRTRDPAVLAALQITFK